MEGTDAADPSERSRSASPAVSAVPAHFSEHSSCRSPPSCGSDLTQRPCQREALNASSRLASREKASSFPESVANCSSSVCSQSAGNTTPNDAWHALAAEPGSLGCTYTRRSRLSSAEELAELVPTEPPSSPSDFYESSSCHRCSSPSSPVSAVDGVVHLASACAGAPPPARASPTRCSGESYADDLSFLDSAQVSGGPARPPRLSTHLLKKGELLTDDEKAAADNAVSRELAGNVARGTQGAHLGSFGSPHSSAECSPTPSGAGPRDDFSDSPALSQLERNDQSPPLFQEEYLHTTPARLDEDEEDVLRRAERVILQQRSRLEQLSSLLLRTENEKVAAYKASQEEVERYLEENRKLRLHLDAANGEVAAMSTVHIRQEKMLDQLTSTLAAAEKGIEDRDRLLSLAQRQDKSEENERLKSEVQQLKCRVEKLTRGATVGSLADLTDGDPRGAGDVAAQLARVQRDIDQHRGTGKQLGLTFQELRVSRMSLMQSQSDLLEAQKMVEEQRLEIQRLYKVIESLNREKSLVPPVVLAPANALAAQGTQEQLGVLLSQVHTLTEKIDSGIASKPQESETFSSVHMSILEEQRNLLAKVLTSLEELAMSRFAEDRSRRRDMDRDVFFTATLLHGQTDDPEEIPLYEEKLVAVRASALAIFEDPEDEEPAIVLSSHKVRQVRQDYNELVFEIDYEVRPGVSEYHYLRCQTDDDMEKWLYALMYSGFVSAPKAAPASLPQIPEPKDSLSWIVPSGKSPEGHSVPICQNNASASKTSACPLIHAS
ncbi:hypothetical protein TGVAND_202120A, partial [Toxoplasma gondii VAND]